MSNEVVGHARDMSVRLALVASEVFAAFVSYLLKGGNYEP